MSDIDETIIEFPEVLSTPNSSKMYVTEGISIDRDKNISKGNFLKEAYGRGDLAANITLRHWTALSTAANGQLRDVAAATDSTRVVAIGGSGTPTDNVQYSDNGEDWIGTDIVDSNFVAITYAKALSKFIIVGTAASDNVGISTDGSSWVLSSTPSDGNWFDVAYAEDKNLIVIVGQAASNNIAYSSDGGTSWTEVTVATTGFFNGITYSQEKGLFVIVGQAGGGTTNIAYSEDAISWTYADNTDAGNLQSVDYSEDKGLFVAVGIGATDNVQYSSDAINWNDLTLGLPNMRKIIYDEYLGRFVVVSSNTGTNNLAHATNPTILGQWQIIETPGENMFGICYSRVLGRLVAVGINAANNIQYSF